MYINLYNEIKIDVYIMINIMLFFFYTWENPHGHPSPSPALLGSGGVMSDFTDYNPTMNHRTLGWDAPGPLSNYCWSTPASSPV